MTATHPQSPASPMPEAAEPVAGRALHPSWYAAPSPVAQAPAQAGEVARLLLEIKMRALNAASLPRDPIPRKEQLRQLDLAADRLAALATQPLAAPVQQEAEAEFTCATLSKAIGCKALSLMQLLQPAPTLNQRLSVNDVATIMAHLYATPPAHPILAPVVREPLTEGQRQKILDVAGAICDGGMSTDDWGQEVINQTERAHGIGLETKVDGNG